jgi:adenine-specific DNA methylase
MGSKSRLLPWLYEIISPLEFNSVLDAFSGSGCVAYLLKTMGKEVVTNDFLKFAQQIALAFIENPGLTITEAEIALLLQEHGKRKRSGLFGYRLVQPRPTRSSSKKIHGYLRLGPFLRQKTTAGSVHRLR